MYIYIIYILHKQPLVHLQDSIRSPEAEGPTASKLPPQASPGGGHAWHNGKPQWSGTLW